MKFSAVLPAALAAVLIVSSCGGSDEASTTDESSTVDSAVGSEVVGHYADGVYVSYAASVESATKMGDDIEAFLDDPTEDTLATARKAWLTARPDYGVTEAFRFYGGPIDADDTGPEGRLNAWPMDESYVDYVEGDPEAGIINDPDEYPTLDTDTLASLNEAGGETNVSTGWHAIEFLLWGQDLSEDGPGERPATDYTDAPNADRRSEYLASATQLLLTDLQGVTDAWDPDGDDNFRVKFLALPTDEALTNIVTGVGELSRGELAGERMSVAYTERSEEDEHSCFSGQHDRGHRRQRPGCGQRGDRRLPGRSDRPLDWPSSSPRTMRPPPTSWSRRSKPALPTPRRSPHRSTSTCATA
ncbi:MAG: iron-regulated protein [Candidatus Microthrix sp.]|nr:imelysin family protein [Candidatus Microthrix sp.]MBK9559215.1 iron-regulated protein [Candidatus Microthrix sp.]